MSNLQSVEEQFKGKRILVTGHTGFTGSWLVTWLRGLGAEVYGLALPPATAPNIYSILNLESSTILGANSFGDIGISADVERAFANAKPEIVFHLAAQPIVGMGYKKPAETFATNVMGTLNVLEMSRTCASTKAVVCVTTDKVYENHDIHRRFVETDRLGGKDPYSASKAAAEIVVSAYQQTMTKRGNDVAIAAARGGNIIGGGDWSDDRIIPDFVRAVTGSSPLMLRNPKSTRPWQHVLALVHGYLFLAAGLLSKPDHRSAWNFGPDKSGNRTVLELVELLGSYWRKPETLVGVGNFVEASVLDISSEKAREELDWRPPLTFEETVRWTAEWYEAKSISDEAAASITHKQIETYRDMLRQQ